MARSQRSLLKAPGIELVSGFPPEDLVFRVLDYDRISFGLYPEELLKGEFPFRWTAPEAQLLLRVEGKRVVLPIMNGHPRVFEVQPKLQISVEGGEQKEIVFRDRAWRDYVLEMPEIRGNDILVRLNVDSPWRPADYRISNDERQLGVAIGRPRWLAP